MTKPTENVPAEALEEALEFERAQREAEREAMTEAIQEARDVADTYADFVTDAVVGLGGSISLLEQLGDQEGANALRSHLTVYLDRMPTPSKVALERDYQQMHQAYHQAEQDRDVFAKALEADGYDPQEVLDEEAAKAEEFIKTLLQGGLVPGVTLDDTNIDPGDQQL
jgi:hypothetical protein